MKQKTTKLLTPHTTEKHLPIFMTSSKASKALVALFGSLGNPIPIDFHDPQQKSALRSRATRNVELRNCNVTPKQAAAVHVNLSCERRIGGEWGNVWVYIAKEVKSLGNHPKIIPMGNGRGRRDLGISDIAKMSWMKLRGSSVHLALWWRDLRYPPSLYSSLPFKHELFR